MTIYRPKGRNLGAHDPVADFRTFEIGRHGIRGSSYGIDPHKIGVTGFSAGADRVANMSDTDERTYR